MERSRSSLTFLDEIKLEQERLRDAVDHRGPYSTFDDWHNIGYPTEPIFQNGWLNFNEAVYQTAGYWKDSAGIVRMRGLIRSGTASVIFVLPQGYRPAPLVVGGGVASYPFGVHAGGGEGRIDINSAGNVTFVGGSNAYVELNKIAFRAQQ